jgi:hypothetical protein
VCTSGAVIYLKISLNAINEILDCEDLASAPLTALLLSAHTPAVIVSKHICRSRQIAQRVAHLDRYAQRHTKLRRLCGESPFLTDKLPEAGRGGVQGYGCGWR